MDGSTATDGWPKPRQKNCNNCVQAKRRCDRRTLVCSRCAEKKIACNYGNMRVASQIDREELEPSSPSMGRVGFGRTPDVNYLGIMPMDAQLGVATTATESVQNYVMDATFDGGIPMNPFINLMDNSLTPTQDQWLVQTEQGPVTERPSSPVDEEIMRAYEKMAGFCVSPIQFPLPVGYSAVVGGKSPPRQSASHHIPSHHHPIPI